MKTIFVNISELYGGEEITMLDDYRKLNPDGEFEISETKFDIPVIIERNDDINNSWEVVAIGISSEGDFENEIYDLSDYARECVHDEWNKAIDASVEIKHYDGVTFQDDYIPECPICGMAGTREDGEVSYPCGHFVEVYNAWADATTIENRWDAAELATHMVSTSHVLGGVNEWFFASDPDLDGVMTSSEIVARYNLNESTVRQAILRGSLHARKSGDVWLVRREDAKKRWGKQQG